MAVGTPEAKKRALLKNTALFLVTAGVFPAIAVTGKAVEAVAMGLALASVMALAAAFADMFRAFFKKAPHIFILLFAVSIFTAVIIRIIQVYIPALGESFGVSILQYALCLLAFAWVDNECAASEKNTFIPIVLKAICLFAVLVVIGCIRELLSSGLIFGCRVIPQTIYKLKLLSYVPGGLILVGIILGVYNALAKNNSAQRGEGGAK